MNKQEFYFSSVGKEEGTLVAEWLPKGEPKAVLHICCDKDQRVQCTEELAKYFTRQGFVVAVCQELKQKEMHYCLRRVKHKYADIPHLLIGCSGGAVTVSSFIKAYPEAVEGAVLAVNGQEILTVDEKLPVLQISGVEENCQEVFRRIYHWTEERLDEMLYHAAIKY